MVFARKYRPRTLAEVVGQPVVVQTLSNAITHKKLHHAYLLIGKFGSGKTSVGRILAASENCSVSPGLNPCGNCDLCKDIFAGRHSDIAEIDAASSAGKVAQIRELKSSANYSPMDGAKTKYYIIDEAHAMTDEATEALLKLLEEPPTKVRFVLCTTEVQKMRGTIMSRCQVHEFKQIYWRDICSHLEQVAKTEKLGIDEASLILCSKMAEGSMRNALQNLEKLVDFCGRESIAIEKAQVAFDTVPDALFYDLIAQICKEGAPDATAGFTIINQMLVAGMATTRIFDGISEVLRNILVASSAKSAANFIVANEEQKARIRELYKPFKAKMQSLISIIRNLVESRIAVQYGQSLDVVLQAWFLESILIFQKG
jgi:DNA polymerase III subunit gamma/tau